MNKNASVRRRAILEIIAADPVHSQEDLLLALRHRGFRVTQPTISRDIRELALLKSPAGYVAPGDLNAPLAPVFPLFPLEQRGERLDSIIAQYVIAAARAGNLVILKTQPAEAQPVARALDQAALPGIIGTIAGDDTVFLAAATSRAAMALVRRFSSILRPSHTRRARR